ncbi:unnamed protein product [Fraxinus pennsylvanica]|uniref:Uncharacterized protein n=1 Tax=Fraxinus pennsylvanica TaxID=56036 RepID=A0AAD1Z2R1_9LAMI|nr:unnamed protein product [Fraxinus pennsylvanica]
MSSICSLSLRVMVHQWRHNHRSLRYWILPHFKRNLSFIPSPVSFSFNQDDDSVPSKPYQLGYDPSEEIFGFSADLQPRSWQILGSTPPGGVADDGTFSWASISSGGSIIWALCLGLPIILLWL